MGGILDSQIEMHLLGDILNNFRVPLTERATIGKGIVSVVWFVRFRGLIVLIPVAVLMSSL